MEFGDIRINNKKVIIKYLILLGITTLSTLIVYMIQYFQTGQFFAIFNVLKTWGKELQIPELPLTTWDAHRLLWLDGSAFLTGFIAFIFLLKFFSNKIKNLKYTINPSVALAFGYIFVVTFYMLLYAGVDGAGGTSIFSLNRYIFATPFFTIFIFYIIKNVEINRNSKIVLASSIFFVCLLYGLLKYLTGIFDFKSSEFYRLINLFVMSILPISIYLFTNLNIKKNLWLTFYMINILLQIYLFESWINGLWIG
jgi:hypothetical protein